MTMPLAQRPEDAWAATISNRNGRLQPADLLDGLRDRERRAFQQELARQQRTIERTPAERLFGHG